LVLILDYLQTHGYLDSCEKLTIESGISLRKASVADNIDLGYILQEFETYYSLKFGKAVVLTRKGHNVSKDAGKPRERSSKLINNNGVVSSGERLLRKNAIPPIGRSSTDLLAATDLSKSTSNNEKKKVGTLEIAKEEEPLLSAVGSRTGSQRDLIPPAAEPNHPVQSILDTKILKPMPFYANTELRELASIITRDIFIQNPNVTWTDIAGLEKSKRLIKEAIVFPIKYPQLFHGLLKPWKGILLYGPPGKCSLFRDRKNDASKSSSYRMQYHIF
jgi:katanin p60 ATPase-containing subunit A1